MFAGQPRTITTTTMPPRAGHSSSPGLDLASLEAAVHRYFRAGIAESTMRVYESAKERYTTLCTERELSQLPLRGDTLCLFVAHLAMAGLKPQTIKTYLSGVRHLQISTSLSDSFMAGSFPRLQYVSERC